MSRPNQALARVERLERLPSLGRPRVNPDPARLTPPERDRFVDLWTRAQASAFRALTDEEVVEGEELRRKLCGLPPDGDAHTRS